MHLRCFIYSNSWSLWSYSDSGGLESKTSRSGYSATTLWIMVLFNGSFSNIVIAILDFSLLLLIKIWLSIFNAWYFVLVLCCFFLDCCFSLLGGIAKSFPLHFSVTFKKEKEQQLLLMLKLYAIGIWKAIQKRSHLPKTKHVKTV